MYQTKNIHIQKKSLILPLHYIYTVHIYIYIIRCFQVSGTAGREMGTCVQQCLADVKLLRIPQVRWCGVVWCSVVQCGAGWCRVVQCGAVWCSVVQCGAVWCRVLQ